MYDPSLHPARVCPQDFAYFLKNSPAVKLLRRIRLNVSEVVMSKFLFPPGSA
jgi:hypothetical protein